MQNSNLGDRIKRYENAYDFKLTPRSCVFIRIDGRAFHTFTKNCVKPFDQGLITAMVSAAKETAYEMMGFKLAYHQSDEVTFMLTDFDKLTTEGWFGYELNKIVSLSASIFTAAFNRYYPSGEGKATFDSRAFVVPLDDAPNVFIWRQQDWERNSLQMLARSVFPHKDLIGKNRSDMHEMLFNVGVNWTALSPREKNGTFIKRDKTLESDKVTYATLSAYFEEVLSEDTA